MTDEMEVEAVAKVIWTDFSGRMGGEWPGKDSQLVAVIQCMATARRALEAARAVRPAGEVGECRYCANTGWFYGDPDLTFCGCAFGKLREELSASPIIDAKVADNLLAGDGYVYFNPDSGEEYAQSHPIESGECEDATDIRRSTAQEDHLWAEVQREFQRAEALSATPTAANASEGDGAYVPQVIEFAEGGYAQLVTEDTATIAAEEMMVQVLRRLAEPRDIIGFQWDLPVSPDTKEQAR